MDLIQLHTVTVTRSQIDVAMRTLIATQGAGQPVTIEEVPSQNIIWVTMRGRTQIEGFLLYLAMVVSGDALAGEVSGLPTVVDTDSLIQTMTVFRTALQELPGGDEVFALKLATA